MLKREVLTNLISHIRQRALVTVRVLFHSNYSVQTFTSLGRVTAFNNKISVVSNMVYFITNILLCYLPALAYKKI